MDKEKSSKLNEIYCNKETTISDRSTIIELPIQSLTLENMYLIITGEKFRKREFALDYSFDENYGMTVTEFNTSPNPNKLRIGFKAYDKPKKE